MQRAELPKGMFVGTYSFGSLRPEDLGPTMLGVLGSLNEESHDGFCAGWEGVVESGFDTTFYPQDANEAINELHDAINEALPEGYVWSALDGDGADFGIWPAPEDGGGGQVNINTTLFILANDSHGRAKLTGGDYVQLAAWALVQAGGLKIRTYKAEQISGRTWGVFEYDGHIQVRRVGPALGNRKTITSFAGVMNQAISDFIARNNLQ